MRRELEYYAPNNQYGSYLFRILWSELSKRDEIPSGLKIPEIRFINVGRFEDEKNGIVASNTSYVKSTYFGNNGNWNNKQSERSQVDEFLL